MCFPKKKNSKTELMKKEFDDYMNSLAIKTYNEIRSIPRSCPVCNERKPIKINKCNEKN